MLPVSFLTTPLAHRGLHDRSVGIIENSPAAIAAAMTHGYGIEIDVQRAADGVPMVFHDDHLDRLTDASGFVRDVTALELSQIPLKGSNDVIPTLDAVLEHVNGAVPLLIEIKDQDGQMGADTGDLHMSIATRLRDYTGPVAVMSFNPNHIIPLATDFPDLPRGLVCDLFEARNWPNIPAETRSELATLSGAAAHHFISHGKDGLDRDQVKELRGSGLPILTWTIRTPTEEATVRQFADNITFEGYLAPRPA